jgi:serine/threonine protein kinase
LAIRILALFCFGDGKVSELLGWPADRNYIMTRYIGSGATSSVYVAKFGKGKEASEVVCKLANVGRLSEDRAKVVNSIFDNERAILSKLKLFGVPRLIDRQAKDRNNNFLPCLFLEPVCERKPLSIHVIRSVVHLMHDLHKSGVIHRDPRTPNILFHVEIGVHLIDYGFAVEAGKKAGLTGAWTYLPLSVLNDIGIRELAAEYTPVPFHDLAMFLRVVHCYLFGRQPHSDKIERTRKFWEDELLGREDFSLIDKLAEQCDYLEFATALEEYFNKHKK